MIFYAFPQAAYLLLFLFFALPALYFLFLYRKKKVHLFSTHAISNGLILSRDPRREWLKAAAFTATWILAVLSLMQPIKYGDHRHLSSFNTDSRTPSESMIFLLDASTSMKVKDSIDGTTRLQYGKEIVEEMINRLRGENAALYAFTSEIIPLSPLTNDILYLKLVLEKLTFNPEGIAGTDLKKTLAQMKREYGNTLSSPVRFILLSDGGDTRIDSLPQDEKERGIQDLLDQIKPLHIDTIGLGSPNPIDIPEITFEGHPVKSSLNETLLKKISEIGGGQYYTANQFTPSRLASTLLSQPIKLEKLPLDTQKSDYSVVHYYQITLSLAILFLLFILKWPDVSYQKQGFLDKKC